MTVKRDEKGRFVKGSRGGGRAKRKTEQEYLTALKEELSMDRWLTIVRRAITDATQGDRHARDWLANYMIGRPPHIVELNAADAQLLKQVLEHMPSGQTAGDLFNAMLIELAEVETDDEQE